MVWQADQQKVLQDFMKEQMAVQHGILQNLVSPVTGVNRAQGTGHCEVAPKNDFEAFHQISERVALSSGSLSLQVAPCKAQASLSEEHAIADLSERSQQKFRMAKSKEAVTTGLLAGCYPQRARGWRK